MDQFFNQHIACFALRAVTGILFLFQGADKIFNVNANSIIHTFRTESVKRFLPDSVLKLTIYISSYVEMIGGILLVIGFQHNIVPAILAVEMIFVALAFSLIKPMWDMSHFFPRFIFLVVLLLLPPEWDKFSLDQILK